MQSSLGPTHPTPPTTLHFPVLGLRAGLLRMFDAFKRLSGIIVNHMFRNTFPMRNYCIIHLSLGDQWLDVRPQVWYVLLVHVVYKRMLQSTWSYSNLQRF